MAVTTISKSQVTTLWSVSCSGDDVPCYVDFKIEGISGVFRVADSYGVNLNKTVCQIEKNLDFIRHYLSVGGERMFQEVEKWENWGNGWEWKEMKHPLQGNRYRLIGSVALLYTTPFGGQGEFGIRSMESLYKGKVESEGITIGRSWNCNRSPETICYFFPEQ